MSTPTFCVICNYLNNWIDKIYCITWYTSTCDIMAMSLLYILDSIVEYVWMCYMGLGSNGCFVIGAVLIGKSL
jgi:hypothetical protein